MIIFVVSGSHRHTHAKLPIWGEIETEIAVWSYSEFFKAERLPFATYVLGDFDRLNAWDLELAARHYRFLRRQGMRVLNDPARVLERHPLLRALKAAGRNSFDAWLLQTDGMPTRYPVFLRTASTHRGAMSDLIYSKEELANAAEALLDRGIPAREILAVEYAAEAIGNVYRKYAAHRVGDMVTLSLSVNQTHWMAKHGEQGIAGEKLYEEELQMIKENRFADAVLAAFDIGNIEYGRADFGLVGGRVQIYEINTNPTMGRVLEHPFPARVESDRLWRARYVQALKVIDAGEGEAATADDPIFVRQRTADRRHTCDRYTA